MSVEATAVVKVLVEVSLDQPWTGNEQFAVIHDKAAREALEKVRMAIEGKILDRSGLRVLGEPVVKIVTIRKQEGEK